MVFQPPDFVSEAAGFFEFKVDGGFALGSGLPINDGHIHQCFFSSNPVKKSVRPVVCAENIRRSNTHTTDTSQVTQLVEINLNL